MECGDQGREGGVNQRLGTRDSAAAWGWGDLLPSVEQGADIHVATGFPCQPPKIAAGLSSGSPKPPLVSGASDGPRHRPTREGFASTEEPVGGGLIPGPQSTGMIQTPDITSACKRVHKKGCQATEPPPPQEHVHTHTPPRAIRWHECQVSRGESIISGSRVMKGLLGAQSLVGVGGNTLCFVLILAQVSLFRLSVLGIIPEVRCGEKAQNDHSWITRQPGPKRRGCRSWPGRPVLGS